MKKTKTKPSGPAIFMYCVIALCAIISVICFTMYYTEIHSSELFLWIAITCFTITYHLWLRIIMGNITMHFKIDYTMWWYKEHRFDKSISKLFRVKKWKDKALTYRPELFSLKDFSLTDIANTMCKAETDHLINVLISLSTIFFGFIWGMTWIFAITAFLAILFDMQFVLIQRYNRPRVVKLINKQNRG